MTILIEDIQNSKLKKKNPKKIILTKKSPIPIISREDVSPGNFQAPFSSPLDSGEFPVPPRGSFGVQTFLGSPQNRRPHREAPRESVVARQPEEDADERHAV